MGQWLATLATHRLTWEVKVQTARAAPDPLKQNSEGGNLGTSLIVKILPRCCSDRSYTLELEEKSPVTVAGTRLVVA